MKETPAVDFLVELGNLRHCKFVRAPGPDEVQLHDGEVLLEVATFAFTANNVTYAVAGDMMSYWNFFPAEAGWGKVPVWGFGDVIRSHHDGVTEGERVSLGAVSRARRRTLTIGSVSKGHALASLRVGWLAGCAAVGQAQHLVIGLDNKIDFTDAGQQVPRPPGTDAVVIVDITHREQPRIVGTLPLMNSLLGPPTNLAVAPDERVALVANSVEWVEDGGTWKPVPDNKLFVIDLQVSPPTLVETVTVGKQPSGMAINKAGTLVLIANRADSSVTVATLKGTQVKVVNTSVRKAAAGVTAAAPPVRRTSIRRPGTQ